MWILHDTKALTAYGRRVSDRCTRKEGPNDTDISLFLHDVARFGDDLLQRARISVGAQDSNRFPVRTVNELVPDRVGADFSGQVLLKDASYDMDLCGRSSDIRSIQIFKRGLHRAHELHLLPIDVPWCTLSCVRLRRLKDLTQSHWTYACLMWARSKDSQIMIMEVKGDRYRPLTCR